MIPIRAEEEEAPRTGPPLRGDVSPLFLIPVVVAGAVAAGLAVGRPTGIGELDATLKILLGALSALAGWVVPWPFLLVGAAVAAVASHGGPLLLPAVGAALATLVVAGSARQGSWPRGRSLLKSAAATTVCQVVLRLSWPQTRLVPSAIAAGCLLLIFIPALFVLRGRPRRYWMSAAGGVLLVAVILSAIAGFSALRAKASLDQAISATRSGLTAVSAGDKSTALRDFMTAERSFSTANGDLGPSVVGEWVPGLSPQVRAVKTAVAIGLRVTTAAHRSALQANLSALQIDRGVLPVRAIASLRRLFRSDYAVIATSLRQTAPFRSPWLVGPLQTKLNSEVGKLRHAEKDARSGLLAARILPGLFGGDGPRRYLLLFENPAESRASGGIVGEYGVLTATNGRLKLGRLGTVEQLNKAGNESTKHLVGPQDYIDRYSQFEPQLYWQNVPLSPDFPSVGEIAANLFPQSGGGHIDGVVSLDPVALEHLMKLTGPLTVPGWPGPVDQANVVEILEHQEFIQFAPNNAARDRFLNSLVRGVWHNLVAQHLPSLPTLARELSPRSLRGHVELYSRQGSEENYFQHVGLAGAMPKVHGDFLGVVTQNAAGNKLDWYLRRHISYSATLNRSTGELRATLRIKLINLSPSSGLPPLIIAPGAGVNTTPGENELYLSVYTPWQEQSATLDNRPLSLVSQQELGRDVYSALVKVPAGGSATIVVHLLGQWPSASEPYRLGLYHQPVIFPDQIRVTSRTVR